MKLEKLVVREVKAFVVQRYVPYRTRKGHLVWRLLDTITGALTEQELLHSPYAECPRPYMVHNQKLSDEESIAALALQEQGRYLVPERSHEPIGG